MNWLLIPAASIHKTSLHSIKTKRKKGLKNFDWLNFSKIEVEIFFATYVKVKILCYFIDLNILQTPTDTFPLGFITLLQKWYEFLILKFLLKAADNMAKNGQESWSQPGFELGSFQREKKVRIFCLKLYHWATEADTWNGDNVLV